MPIHTRRNRYRGVNAHLHSLMQREPGRWEGFHSTHITHLAEAIDLAINQQFPGRYLVQIERSMQIRARQSDTDET